MQQIPLRRISVFRGSRVTTIIHPRTGERITHGLGSVGEPLVPYLDRSSDGYMLAIAPAPDATAVYVVDVDAEPLASGRFPQRRVPFADLGADDVDPLTGAAK